MKWLNKGKKLIENYGLIMIIIFNIFPAVLILMAYNISFRYEPPHFPREFQEGLKVSFSVQQNNTTKCHRPQDHIFFLKIHKCGSSTVQNILMRRGLMKKLNFVLPAKANYLGHPALFDPNLHIGRLLKLPDTIQQYEIFTHHTRYHRDNIAKIMPSDTKKITILREPAALFESLYHFYNLKKFFKQRNLKQILKRYSINKLIILFLKVGKNFKRQGTNQMAYDFGMDRESFNDTYEKQKLFDTIDQDFDLVMISEYMEASLVLLADIMCWSLEEIRFLKLNARPEKIKEKFNKNEIKKLNILNNIDNELYKYYLEKFKLKIKIYGKKRMEDNILKLLNLNNKLMDDCVWTVMQPRLDNKTYPVMYYKLKINAPTYCNFVIMAELNFTEILRDQQIYKFNVIKNFNNLFPL